MKEDATFSISSLNIYLISVSMHPTTLFSRKPIFLLIFVYATMLIWTQFIWNIAVITSWNSKRCRKSSRKRAERMNLWAIELSRWLASAEEKLRVSWRRSQRKINQTQIHWLRLSQFRHRSKLLSIEMMCLCRDTICQRHSANFYAIIQTTENWQKCCTGINWVWHWIMLNGTWHDITCREIVQRDFGIKWADVQGNAAAKQLLRDTVIMPLNYPDLFKGIVRPWRGILLHGPSGTGKTLMAKALCAETHGKVTFFNVSASTITSKWRGDSEKFIKVYSTVSHYILNHNVLNRIIL